MRMRLNACESRQSSVRFGKIDVIGIEIRSKTPFSLASMYVLAYVNF